MRLKNRWNLSSTLQTILFTSLPVFFLTGGQNRHVEAQIADLLPGSLEFQSSLLPFLFNLFVTS